MKKTVYSEVATYANCKNAERSEVVVGRDGSKKSIRRYHLLKKKQIRLLNQIESTGRFVNPYGTNRIYGMIINSLIECGENASHTLGDVFMKFREIASKPGTMQNGLTAWDRFASKAPRNEDTHLEAFPRFLYNVEYLQRIGGIHPWGLKLAQLGACIDVLKDKEGMILIRLRTNIPTGSPITPINMNRVRQVMKTVQSLPSKLVIEDGED
jgi:hypothetical protein